MAKRILYGASVQGIQGFIFQTNRLKDISGASELVEEICTTTFAKAILEEKLNGNENEEALRNKLNSNPRILLNAAGNIKYLPDTPDECKNLVRKFPKLVQLKAPGITVSQAVVYFDDENKDSFSNAVLELESRLRIQRNIQSRSITLGMMGIRRSRNTGLPAIQVKGEDYLDASTLAKRFTCYERKEERKTINLYHKALSEEIESSQVPYDISHIIGKNDWIAVIHADGNGLGQIVQKIGKDAAHFKEFSVELNNATIQAARLAYQKIQESYTWSGKVPIRPVVLGGDDFTVICRADLALDYVKYFIQYFEEETGKMHCFGPDRSPIFTEGLYKSNLSACAGIAYVKSSYPFYYAYSLAESLCSDAKKDAKDRVCVRKGTELPASCLMFHKLQDSFMEDYEELKKRELCPNSKVTFVHGPYYLKVGAALDHKKWTIDQLAQESEKLGTRNEVKSHLRNWMSTVFTNEALSRQYMERLKKRLELKGDSYWIGKINQWTSVLESDGVISTPVYDLLALHTLKNQETK